MATAALLGMAIAIGLLLATMLREGSSPMAIMLAPPLILVFGGTFGAAIARSTVDEIRRIGGWFRGTDPRALRVRLQSMLPPSEVRIPAA